MLGIQQIIKEVNKKSKINNQENTKKEKVWTTGILVLIDQTIYHFTDEKAWESQQTEQLKKQVQEAETKLLS